MFQPMRKDETPAAYAVRCSLSKQEVLKALNEIPIEAETPAEAAAHAPAVLPGEFALLKPAPEPAVQTLAESPNTLTETPVKQSMSPPEDATGQRHAEWRRLRREGNSINVIAAKTGVAYQTVYNYLIKEGLHKPNSAVRPIASISVEQLDEQEARLQEQLQAVQRRKQLLAEAKMLNVDMTNDGIVIRKEGNLLSLTFDDADKLATKLTELLVSHLDSESEA